MRLTTYVVWAAAAAQMLDKERVMVIGEGTETSLGAALLHLTRGQASVDDALLADLTKRYSRMDARDVRGFLDLARNNDQKASLIMLAVQGVLDSSKSYCVMTENTTSPKDSELTTISLETREGDTFRPNEVYAHIQLQFSNTRGPVTCVSPHQNTPYPEVQAWSQLLELLLRQAGQKKSYSIDPEKLDLDVGTVKYVRRDSGTVDFPASMLPRATFETVSTTAHLLHFPSPYIGVADRFVYTHYKGVFHRGFREAAIKDIGLSGAAKHRLMNGNRPLNVFVIDAKEINEDQVRFITDTWISGYNTVLAIMEHERLPVNLRDLIIATFGFMRNNILTGLDAYSRSKSEWERSIDAVTGSLPEFQQLNGDLQTQLRTMAKDNEMCFNALQTFLKNPKGIPRPMTCNNPWLQAASTKPAFYGEPLLRFPRIVILQDNDLASFSNIIVKNIPATVPDTVESMNVYMGAKSRSLGEPIKGEELPSSQFIKNLSAKSITFDILGDRKAARWTDDLKAKRSAFKPLDQSTLFKKPSDQCKNHDISSLTQLRRFQIMDVCGAVFRRTVLGQQFAALDETNECADILDEPTGALAQAQTLAADVQRINEGQTPSATNSGSLASHLLKLLTTQIVSA